MRESERFTFDIGWALLGSVITVLVGSLLTIFIARWLGVNDLGLYRLTFTIYGIGILVPVFSISSALIKYVAEYKDDKDKLDQMVSSGIIASVILGLIVAFIVFFLSNFLADLFKMPALKTLLKVLSIIFPFTALYQSQIGILNGLREMRYYAFLMIGQNILMCILIVGLISAGYGVNGAIWGLVFSMIAVSSYGLFFLKKFFRFNLTGYVQNTIKILSFGGKTLCGGAINEINYRADILLIGYFLSAASVGYYAVAISLSRFFWIIPQSIQKITYPATSAYWSENNRSALQEMIDKTMKYNACALLSLGLGIGFFAGDIATFIFGKEFTYAIFPLMILLVGTVIDGAIIRPINSTLAAIGRPEFGPKIASVGAIINIILNLLLIPRFGIAGAAIATTISLLIVAFLNMFLIVKNTNLKIDFQWYTRLSILVLGCISLYFLFGHLNRYIIGGSIMVIFITVLWFHFLLETDRNYLLNLIRRLVIK